MIHKAFCFFILLTLLLVSCQKDDQINNYPAKVSFIVSGRLLEGKHIDCIATDTKGNICIASEKELYFTDNKTFKSYNLDFKILDLAIAPDETVWIGTNGGGLGHFANNKFTWYTSANSGLPRDYVKDVEIAPDGNVWFTSCAFNLGGLGVYDGNKFRFYTPENSPLNQNIVEDIEIDPDGNVYIATSGTVGRTNIYRISYHSWDCLGDKNGTFYWVFSFAVGPSGTIYLVEDFSLSSYWPNPNKLFEFRDNKWQNIETEGMPDIGLFTRIKADKRNYCWVEGFYNDSPFLSVYNGKSWFWSPSGTFPADDFITAFEIDNNNNVLVGTYSNGVFIINQ